MPTLRERLDLSIIIPCYNLERWIAPMLESIKAQDPGEYTFEVIFVLNNCTDDTEGVIRKSGLDCRVIYETTQGCGPARNSGYEIARGDYVWFVDGDDWFTTNKAVQIALDRAGGALDVVYIPFASLTYPYQYFSMACQYLLRREFVKDLRFPEYQPAEDDAYIGQMLNKVGRNWQNYFTLPSVDEPLVYYNYGREGSNMWRYTRGEKI